VLKDVFPPCVTEKRRRMMILDHITVERFAENDFSGHMARNGGPDFS
jgi:hypothetical protein